jgi:hypothetical protein
LCARWQEILAFIAEFESEPGAGVPAAHVLAGDFNTLPNTSEIARVLRAGFVDAWSGPLPDTDGSARWVFVRVSEWLI